jgi:hypothetical protein
MLNFGTQTIENTWPKDHACGRMVPCEGLHGPIISDSGFEHSRLLDNYKRRA